MAQSFNDFAEKAKSGWSADATALYDAAGASYKELADGDNRVLIGFVGDGLPNLDRVRERITAPTAHVTAVLAARDPR